MDYESKASLFQPLFFYVTMLGNHLIYLSFINRICEMKKLLIILQGSWQD